MLSPNIGSLAVSYINATSNMPLPRGNFVSLGCFCFRNSLDCVSFRPVAPPCLVSCILAPPFLFAFGLAFGFARVRPCISHFDKKDPLFHCFFALRFYFLILPWAGLVGGELLENFGECSSATKAVVYLRLACVSSAVKPM